MKQVFDKLQQQQVGDVREKEPLANHTTWKIGGPADVLVIPNDLSALQGIMQTITEFQVPWRVIGRGSNLLVADLGIEGVVIKLGKGMDALEVNGEEIRVGAGYPVVKLATLISRQGLSV